MNNCLADLSRLIPAEYLKKGRGRVEKTEIIEMAIRHMKHLQGLRQGTNRINQKESIRCKSGFPKNACNFLITQPRLNLFARFLKITLLLLYSLMPISYYFYLIS